MADGDPIVDDNLDLDRDVEPGSRVVIEDEAPGVLRGGDGTVVTKGEKGGDTPKCTRLNRSNRRTGRH